MNLIYEAAVIGAGPSGISASLYIKRANLNVTIIHNNTGSLLKAGKIENYYGIDKNGSTGEELYRMGITQAGNLGVNILDGEVVDVLYNFDGANFIIKLADGTVIESKAVLLSLGEAKRIPEIENFNAYLHKGISFCAVCDGFLYKNKDIAVIGNGSYALHEAEELREIAKSVTILTDGMKETADFSGFKVINEKIKSLFGNGRLAGVEFIDSATGRINIDALFVAIGSADSENFIEKLGILRKDDGKPQLDADYMSSLPGLFFAGDFIAARKQIAEAVYTGMNAAFGMIKFLRISKNSKL